MTHCSVPGCKRKSSDPQFNEKVSFHRVPAVENRWCKFGSLLEERRKLWLEAIGYGDPKNGKTSLDLKNEARLFVCSRHFVSGKPSGYFENYKIDWIPTVNMDYEENTRATELTKEQKLSNKKEIQREKRKTKLLNQVTGRTPINEPLSRRNEKENNLAQGNSIIIVEPEDALKPFFFQQQTMQPQFQIMDAKALQNGQPSVYRGVPIWLSIPTDPQPESNNSQSVERTAPQLQMGTNDLQSTLLPSTSSQPVQKTATQLKIKTSVLQSALPFELQTLSDSIADSAMSKSINLKVTLNRAKIYKYSKKKTPETDPSSTQTRSVFNRTKRPVKCAVPTCENNSHLTPEKEFFTISSILIIRAEVYLRIRWSCSYFSPPMSYKTRFCCCEDHYSSKDFVEPNTRPLVLKRDVLPHLLRKNRVEKNQYVWLEYIPGDPLALDKPPTRAPERKWTRKLKHVVIREELQDMPSDLDEPKRAKVVEEEPSEEEIPDDFVYKETASDAESWKDEDLEDEELTKITEEAITAGKTVRTRRDCKITEWQLLPKNLTMKKDDTPKPAEPEEPEDEEPIYQYVPLQTGDETVEELPHLEMTEKCHYCDEKFPNRGLRSRHMQKEHIEYSLFICGLCRRKLGNQKTFYQHMWNHMKVANQCDICDKQFVTKENFEKHRAKHLLDDENSAAPGSEEGQKIQCLVCFEMVDNEDQMATHMLEHGLDSADDAGEMADDSGDDAKSEVFEYQTVAFLCDICDKQFVTRKELSKHRAEHVMEFDYSAASGSKEEQKEELSVSSEAVINEELPQTTHIDDHGLPSSHFEEVEENSPNSGVLESMKKFARDLLTDVKDKQEVQVEVAKNSEVLGSGKMFTIQEDSKHAEAECEEQVGQVHQCPEQ